MRQQSHKVVGQVPKDVVWGDFVFVPFYTLSVSGKPSGKSQSYSTGDSPEGDNNESKSKAP